MTGPHLAVASVALVAALSAWTSSRSAPRAAAMPVADSIVLTVSAFGDARPRGSLHPLRLTNLNDPGNAPRLRAASVLFRGDTFHVTLPASLRLGIEPVDLRLNALGDTPNLQFTIELPTIGSDSVGVCTGEGRGLELIRLPEGSVLHRVDGARPLRCRRAGRR